MATRREAGNEPMTGGLGRESRSTASEAMSGAKEKAEGITEKVKHRAKDAVENRKEQTAERIESVGERIDRRAESMEMEGGLKRQAGKVMHRTSDALEGSADYLRTHEIGTIRDDVKSQIREHPLLSVGLALGTGYVLGRVFGGNDEEEEEREFEQWRRSGRLERDNGGLTNQLGRALMGGVGSMVERRVRGY